MKPQCVIGLTGGSGSGKTSLRKGLRDNFDEECVSFISQDNYYRMRENQLTDAEGIKNFDLPKSFHMRQFAGDIEKLRNGEVVTRKEYTYNNPEATPSIITIKPAPVLVVEGLFIMHKRAVRKQLDITFYVEVDDVLKIKRRILRDRKERNYPLEDVLYRYEHHVLPAYKKYIEPYREEATMIVNNNHNMALALGVVTGYIRQLCTEHRTVGHTK